jgi:outer membrane protein
MQKNSLIKLIFSLFFLFTGLILWGQDRDSSWTLPKCIDQAMEKNISIQGKVLSNNTNLVDWEETKAKRLPSLNASVSQNFEWSRSVDVNNNFSSYAGSNGTNFGINSSLSLYNGFKTKNSIKQAELSYKAGNYDVETLKESISLNVLNAYLQILYSTELVKNSQKQVEATSEQLFLSDERLKLGSISRSDYLQVKSELASEKYTLANAQNQLAVNKVALMQLMEIPVTDSFNIKYPVIDIQQDSILNIAADSIYKIALELKPQVKSSEINKEISELGISIARAGYQPTLTLSAGINTAYGSNLDIGYYQQFQNKVVPSVGLNLSIPIYQNKVLKSNVAYAKINSENATLNEVSTKNELRKSIEQACVDYQSAIIKYQASLDKYNSAEESYKVSQEKFNQGLLNSVDFLVQKTNLIAAESELLQAKYNLVFGKKIIDFYTGTNLTL